MAEGTVFFPGEPILRVTAPIPEAQLVESRLVNLLHFEVLVASKAARSVLVANGRRLIDFGMRRAHGAEAGLLAARAAYLAGFDGTSAVLAAPRFGIPVFGTMAHSFVQSHESEWAAFAHFARAFPRNALLLIDTYDTVAAARKVAALAPELAREGIALRGVRLDSGDLDALARAVRDVLDRAGLPEATIFASGNLDEHRVRDPSLQLRRSTPSAWARVSSPRRTRRVSTRSTSCRSTRAGRGASGRRERQLGPAASRSTGTTARTAGSRATWSPRSRTCNPARR
jgi:nicotinate phosphoribosyltransferase